MAYLTCQSSLKWLVLTHCKKSNWRTTVTIYTLYAMSAQVSHGQKNGCIKRHRQEQRQADIYETHRCVSKKQDIEHITVQNITFRMNWPCMGKQVHQSSVKAAVFSTGGKNRWVTARITAQDTGCYRSTFPLIHVHQPDAIFRPYPSNQIIYLSYCVLEIQIKWNINQMITNVQKTANTKFSLPYAALYLLF
jgi:hypothetical protein